MTDFEANLWRAEMAEEDARRMTPADRIRAAVLARAIALHGTEKGAKAAAARLVGPRWGYSPDDAASRLSRWLNGKGDITADALAELLDVLGLDVVPRE
jgi:hypothetical protein